MKAEDERQQIYFFLKSSLIPPTAGTNWGGAVSFCWSSEAAAAPQVWGTPGCVQLQGQIKKTFKSNPMPEKLGGAVSSHPCWTVPVASCRFRWVPDRIVRILCCVLLKVWNLQKNKNNECLTEGWSLESIHGTSTCSTPSTGKLPRDLDWVLIVLFKTPEKSLFTLELF